MSDETYKVTVKGAGLNLEREVPAKVGDQVVLLILTGQGGKQPPALDASAGASARPEAPSPETPAGASMSVREYLDSCEAKRSPDKITAIGCFLKEQRGQGSFSRADLERLFEDAAEPVPKNIPRDLKWAIRVGWISPKSDEKGSYYVTAKGTDVVRKKFPKDVIKKTSQTPARTRRGSGNKRSKE